MVTRMAMAGDADFSVIHVSVFMVHEADSRKPFVHYNGVFVKLEDIVTSSKHFHLR